MTRTRYPEGPEGRNIHKFLLTLVNRSIFAKYSAGRDYVTITGCTWLLRGYSATFQVASHGPRNRHTDPVIATWTLERPRSSHVPLHFAKMSHVHGFTYECMAVALR